MAVTIKENLQAMVGPENWELGQALYQEKAILDTHISGRGLQARLANGRGFEKVKISTRRGKLRATCSCPKHANYCEHVVACLLMLADENPELISFLRENGESADSDSQDQEDDSVNPEALPQGRLRNPVMTMKSLRHLLASNAVETGLILRSEHPIGTMESQWNRLTLSAKIRRGNRIYAQGNLRRLVESGVGAGSMCMDDFPPQEQQIIRYLVAHAEFGSTTLQVNAYDLADLFHALGGFTHFEAGGSRIHIHPQRLDTVVEVYPGQDDARIIPRLVLPGHGHLPPERPTYIAGRAGYWIGFGSEYWWLPGFFPGPWLQLFLKSRAITLAEEELSRLQKLCSENRVQSRLIPGGGMAELSANPGRCKPVLTLDWTRRGIHGTLEYNYSGQRVCALGPGVIWAGTSFVSRNGDAEKQYQKHLTELGFLTHAGNQDEYWLTEPEAMWEFIDQRLSRLEPEWELYWTPRFSKHLESSGDLQLSMSGGDEGQSWFETQCEFRDDSGARIPWDELSDAVRAGDPIVRLSDGTLVRLPGDILHILSIFERRGKTRDNGKTFHFVRHAAVPLAQAMEGVWSGPEPAWKSIRDALEKRELRQKKPVPQGVWGKLRDYQREGVRWLQVLEECGFHGILADEMGLGKTIQTLAAIASRKAAGNDAPSLVVCPTSLLENWLVEANRFVPELRCAVIRGSERQGILDRLEEYDLLITSYALLRRDVVQYDDTALDYLVLDEAQHIKNPHTANARTCKELEARHRLILTGTPLENSLAEIWSLFDFLLPGYLGSHREFRQSYEIPALAGDVNAVADQLAPLLHPFILRRTKREVCAELPPKLEQVVFCELGPQQQQVYDTLLAAGRQMLQSTSREDWNRRQFEILSLLLRMRQACCHPALLPEDLFPRKLANIPSAKLELAQEVILEAIDSGHRLLLFSQFTSVLALFPDWLDQNGIPYEYLDGSTTRRQERVDRFNNDPSIPIFLLSLKAGGTGLNLVGADTVIHYDLWWNPMVEDQATDRTHRIGQTQTVTAIKLVARHTIEERILQLQESKRDLFNRLVTGATGKLAELTPEDIEFLLEPVP